MSKGKDMENKVYVITVRLTESENDALNVMVKATGQTKSDLVRKGLKRLLKKFKNSSK